MNQIPSEMLRGHIDTIILLCLIDGDMHTNQIKEEITQRAGGDFKLQQGTFYSALQRIVKQGYVKEYRTSAADGVRRKFYQLTEKGKIYIDENKDKWTYSREMINVLIETPRSELPKISVKQQEEPQNIVTTIIQQEEESSPEDALNDFLNGQTAKEEPETKVEPQVEIKEEQPKQTKKQIKDAKDLYKTDLFELIDITQSEIYQEHSTPVKEEKPNIKTAESVNTQKFEEAIDKAFEKIYERIEEKFEDAKAEEQPANTQVTTTETEQNQEKIAFVDVIPIKEATQEKIAPENDDFYTGDQPVTQDYKTVLAKIFDEDKPKEQRQKNEREIIYQEGLDVNGILAGPATDEQHQQLSYPHHSKQVKKEKYKQQKQRQIIREESAAYIEKQEVVKHPYYDFSDIQSMADEEGFKIKISSSDRKQDGGRILINKLLFHSSITFFAIILIEWLLVYFATKDIAQLSFVPFAIFFGIMAIMPIYTGIMYIIDKKKKVSRISSFKSALELMAIIMLNLILIEIVCCVLANLDFSNQVLVVRYVIYPIFFVINLPIYLFIKYLKLDKNNYYM